jgi:hypothetical protein
MVARAIDEDAVNASDDSSGLLIKNSDHFSIVQTAPTAVKFAAKYPGALGNSISVHMADSATFATWAYKNRFDSAPGTSDYAASVGASNDELHIVVVDSQGLFSGVAGSVLESFSYLSKASNSKDANNAPNFYVNQINNNSKYVWALAIPTGNEIITPTSGIVTAASVGAGGTAYTTATVTFSPPPVGGTTATGTATISGGAVTAITITSGGSGYLTAPTITITGDGTGATATATLGVSPTSAEWGTTLVSAGVGMTFKSLASALALPLGGGADSTLITSSDLIRCYDLFANSETVDVSLIFLGDAGGAGESTVVKQ